MKRKTSIEILAPCVRPTKATFAMDWLGDAPSSSSFAWSISSDWKVIAEMVANSSDLVVVETVPKPSCSSWTYWLRPSNS